MERIKRNEIKEALDNAIKDVMRNEYQLLKDKCSERAIVHWLANYFLRRMEMSDFAKAHPDFLLKRDYEREKPVVTGSDSRLGYTVDVEYNRMGDQGESKQLDVFCRKCEYNENCSQKSLEKWNKKNNKGLTCSAMLDMVFHQRRQNKEGNNILCVEVKTTSTIENDCKTRCDKKRINELVRGSGMISPQYQFGAAIHIYEEDKASVWFYERGKEEPTEAYPVELKAE